MPRPTGVTLIAILYWIASCAVILLGLGLFAASGYLGESGRIAGWGWVASLGKIGAILLIGFGGLGAFVGYGLWTLQEWARVTAIVFSVLGILAFLPGFFLLHGVFFMPIRLVRLAINVGILWYLFQPQAQRAFRHA